MHKMTALNQLKKHLKPGQVYRRHDLAQWSTAVDRHIRQLVEAGTLQKMAQGLYYCPAQASFGAVPPEDETLVAGFLKTTEFLLTSPNRYNALAVGTTQLYNTSVVYNHKRHGRFVLGGKTFDFRLKHKFPKELSREFLLVDLLNNINDLAEDTEEVLQKAKERILENFDGRMKSAFDKYAGERTKTRVNQWFAEAGSEKISPIK